MSIYPSVAEKRQISDPDQIRIEKYHQQEKWLYLEQFSLFWGQNKSNLIPTSAHNRVVIEWVFSWFEGYKLSTSTHICTSILFIQQYTHNPPKALLSGCCSPCVRRRVNITQHLRDNKAPGLFRTPALSLCPQSGSTGPNRARLWALMSLRLSWRCPNWQRDGPMRSWHQPGGQPGVRPRYTMPCKTVPTQGSWEIETAWGNERQQLCLPVVELVPWRESTKGEQPRQLWHPDISHSATCCMGAVPHCKCTSFRLEKHNFNINM